MSLTIMAAAKEVAALPKPFVMEDVCKAISFGSLRVARGNVSSAAFTTSVKNNSKSFDFSATSFALTAAPLATVRIVPSIKCQLIRFLLKNLLQCFWQAPKDLNLRKNGLMN